MMVKKAMLGKWRWRLIYGATCLCRNILYAKYNVNHVLSSTGGRGGCMSVGGVEECLSFRSKCR